MHDVSCAPTAPAGAKGRERTPGLILGPFYPVTRPPHAGAELCTVACGAAIQAMEISGRVTNLAGAPVAAARVEIWQADEAGHYRHPSAPHPAPADDTSFAGYGQVFTDASGRYRFRTRKPGPYGEGPHARAPHIHFQVTGAHDRLVTQMFFPHEALNAQDRWYGAVSRPQRLVARLAERSALELLRLEWDIVLATG